MTRYLLLGGLIFVAFAGWSIGEKLSSDALGMAVGLLFGLLASIPAALLVLATSRRARRARPGGQVPAPQQPQPPVIVVAAPPAAGYGYPQQFAPYGVGDQRSLPASQRIIDAQPQRQFRVVGEEDELIDSF